MISFMNNSSSFACLASTTNLPAAEFAGEQRQRFLAEVGNTNGLTSALKSSSWTSFASWSSGRRTKKTVRFAEPLVALRSALKGPSAQRLKKKVLFADQLKAPKAKGASKAVQRADLQALESEASPLKDQRRQERRKALMKEIKADERAEKRRADQLARRLVRESIAKERREQRERQRALEKLTKALLRQHKKAAKTAAPKATTSTKGLASHTPSCASRHQRRAAIKKRLAQDPDFKASLGAAAPSQAEMEHPMVRRSLVVRKDKEDVKPVVEAEKVPELTPLKLSLLGGPLANPVNHPSAPAAPWSPTVATVAPVVRRSARLLQRAARVVPGPVKENRGC